MPKSPNSPSRRRRRPAHRGRLVVLTTIVAWWAVGFAAAWFAIQSHQVDTSSAAAEKEARLLLLRGDRAGAEAAASDHLNGTDGYGGLVTTYAIAGGLLLTALSLWAARDAKARGENGWEWLPLLVMVTGGVFLLLYLPGRPAGGLVDCPICGDRRLADLPLCPHCGTSLRPRS